MSGEKEEEDARDAGQMSTDRRGAGSGMEYVRRRSSSHTSKASVTSPRIKAQQGSGLTQASAHAAASRKVSQRVSLDAAQAGLLLASFSCAVERKVLHHGKLHVFERVLVHESHVFGKTKLYIPRDQVATVAKKKVNRLRIVTVDGTKHTFASFASRQKCYDLITGVVTSQSGALSDEPSETESVPPSDTRSVPVSLHADDDRGGALPQAVLSASASSEDVLEQQDREPEPAVRKLTKSSNPRQSSSAAKEGALEPSTPPAAARKAGNQDLDAQSVASAVPADGDAPSKDSVPSRVPRPASPPPAPVDPEASLLWQQPDDALDLNAHECSDQKEFCAKTTLPCSVKVAAHHLFLDDACGASFLKDYHLTSGDREPISVEAWTRETAPASVEAKQWYKRKVQFTHPLSYKIGPSQTVTAEAHTLCFLSNGGVQLEAEGHNLDVPYSDSFRVESTFELTPLSESSAELNCYVATRFVGKKPMVAKMIEKGTFDDCGPAYKIFCNTAANHVAQAMERLYPPSKEADAVSLSTVTSAADEPQEPENDDDLPDPEAGLVWADKERDVFDKVHGELYDSKTECAKVEIPRSVRVVYNALMLDGRGGEFLIKYHTVNGDKEPMSVGEWGKSADGAWKTREVRFVHPIAYKIGPSQTVTVETQFLSFTSAQGGFILEAEGHNLDVPYSDQFRAESTFEFTPVAGGERTLLTAYATTRFIGKKPMVAKIIEKGTVDDCGPAYKKFCDVAVKEVESFYETLPGVSERKARAQRRAQKRAAAAAATAGGVTRKSTGRTNKSLTVPQRSAVVKLHSNVVAKAPFEVFGLDGNFVMEAVLLVLLFLIFAMLFFMFITLVSMKLDVASISSVGAR